MACLEEEVRKLRIDDLEIHISGLSGAHSILQCIRCDILTSLWHSFFCLFVSDFNKHTEKTLLQKCCFQPLQYSCKE